MPLSPEEQKELDELLKVHGDSLQGEDAAAAQRYRQAAAQLPTTNEADAWIRRPQTPGPDQGKVLMYEPPLVQVQKALAENPDRAAALIPERYSADVGLPLSQDEIAGLTTDHPLYRAYADDLWDQAAQQAATKGKTAYRYSRAPTLNGSAAGMGPLDTLGMKLGSAADDILGTGESFVLGMDNAMTLSLAGRAIEAGARQDAKTGNVANAAASGLNPAGSFAGPLDQLIGTDIHQSAMATPGGTDIVGGGDGGREEVLAEHPVAGISGQVLGTLNPIGASNAIYRGAAGLAKPLAGAAPGILRSAGVAGLAGAGAGATEQVGREAVGAGMNALQSGQRPQLEPGWGDRAKIAAVLGGTFGLGADLIGQAANGTAKWIAEPGGRFKGLPAEFEASGGTFTGGGPKPPPELDPLIERARARGDTPVDTKALDLKGPIQDSTKANVTAATTKVGETERAFYPTQEGQLRLPANNVVQTAVDTLDKQYGADARIIGDGKSPANWTREQLNTEIAGVSLDPVEGGIPLDPKRAELYLADPWKRELLDRASPKAAEAGPTTGAREIDPSDLAPKKEYSLAGKTLKDLGHDSIQPEKLAAAREKPSTDAITLYDDPEKGLRLVDGRHRFTLAKERGDATISAVVRDPKSGNVLFEGELPLKQTSDFENTLKRRGIGKVWLVPRRHDAQDHDQLVRTYQDLRITDDPAARDAQKLWIAALKDRDARPMNGAEGGWSKQQQEHSRMIGGAKGEAGHAAPDGNAFKPLVQYANKADGQAELSDALRAAAVRGGKLGDLEQMRVLGMLDQLNELANLGGGSRGSSPWMPGRLVNAASIRGLPALRAAGNPATSPLRGGRGGLAGSMLNLLGTSLDDKSNP